MPHRHNDDDLIGEEEVSKMRMNIDDKSSISVVYAWSIILGMVTVVVFAVTIKTTGDNTVVRMNSAEARMTTNEIATASQNSQVSGMTHDIKSLDMRMERMEKSIDKISDRLGVKP